MAFPEEIPHFQNPFKHPDWAFAQPTATYDVYFYYLRFPKDKKTAAFSIFYEESMSVQFFIEEKGGTLRVRFRIEGEKIPTDLSSEEIEEATWNQASLWLVPLNEATDHRLPPTFSCQYKIWEDLEREISRPFKESLLLGFFNGPGDSDEIA